MRERGELAAGFEAHRERLRSIAWRMLGSRSEAEDAVQEAWLRLDRSDPASVDNLGGWLTTVVARVCLDQLRARRVRSEERGDAATAEGPAAPRSGADDPERDALLGESVGRALLVVLETLGPAERVAFVLHDLFDLSFEEIAPIVGRKPAAARQLASRARRKVRGTPPAGAAGHERHRELVAAFLAASRGGDLAALVALLDPDAVVRADAAGVRMGARPEAQGAAAVAATFAGRAQGAELAWVDGAPALVWAVQGRPRVLFLFTVAAGRIAAIDLVADPDRLAAMEIVRAGR